MARPKRKTQKKEYTFADQAKEIAKMFPRRETDVIEKRDYKQAMTQLMQEQEAVRTSMGLGEPQETFAMGGPKGKTKLQQYYADQAKLGADAANKAQAKFAKDYLEPATIAAASTLAGPAVLGALGKVGQGSINAFKAANATGATDAWVVEQMAKGIPHALKALPFTMGTEYLHSKAGTHSELPLGLRSKQFAKLNDKTLGQQMKSNMLPEVRVTKPRYTDRFTEKHSKAYGGKIKYQDGGPGKITAPVTKPMTWELNQAVVDMMGNPDIFTPAGEPVVSQPYRSPEVDGSKYKTYPARTPWQSQGIGDMVNLPSRAALNPYNTKPLVSTPGNIFRNPSFEVVNTPNDETQNDPRVNPTNVPPATVTTPGNTTAVTTPAGYDPNSRMVTNTARMRSLNVPQDMGTLDSTVAFPDTSSLELGKLGNGKLPGTVNRFRSPRAGGKNEFLPTALAGATNIGTNLALAAMAKKNQPRVNAAMVSPERVNMAAQREQLRRDAGVSRNIAVRNARNLGLNPGATAANIGAASAGVGRGLGDQLTRSNLAEQQINAQFANRAGLANQASANRAAALNAQLEQRGLDTQLGYLGAAGETLSAMPREHNLMQRNREQMDWWNRYLDYLNTSYGNQPFLGVPKFGG